MMAYHRPDFSRSAALFLVVLLAIPVVARCAAREEALKILARKIAAELPAKENVTLSVKRGFPSLVDEDVETSLTAELQGLGIRASSEVASATVEVTYSENLTDVVLITHVHGMDRERVIVTSFARVEDHTPDTKIPAIALLAEPIWEGPERVLDIATLDGPNGNSRLLLLVPDGLIVREPGSEGSFKIQMSPVNLTERFPNRWFLRLDDPLPVRIGLQTCRFALASKTYLGCDENRELVEMIPTLPGFGNSSAHVSGSCMGTNYFLGTGEGDFTEPDFVGILRFGAGEYHAFGSRIVFNGPVVYLRSLPNASTATAIVQNLSTGNYEAYRISVSCAQ